ncbi:uncharacterized protein LOC123543734 isoform X2 [Mercenaria mercenaria]|uniref:uncharacterized protein LOC123543734 isoform X2 n=1 Tax=Mercenaria mercenaria TaxID=6596 RepID=UPI00234E98B8|nr:uncharacterized protein LOC123543734 isoform X2 [Mercenaria mercenaria]
MASPRHTFRNINTPSKQKREPVNTPSKRAKFRQLFDEPDNNDILVEKISVVKDTFLRGTEVQDPSILTASLVCTYGLNYVVRLLGAIRHVPNSFLERYQYIFKIMNCDGNHLSLNLVEKYVRSLQVYANQCGFEVDRNTLWSCTNKYDEGFLVFLVPPVSECLQCSGTLYPLNKVQVTLFTMNGPRPGMKTTTRCKKGCGAIYNVDRYSCPAKGTFFYSEKQPVISSSNCVYLTRDVHELLCESGNHAFVSHHAFSEIYNSLFSNCVHTNEFRKWLVSRKEECAGEEISEEEVYQLNSSDILEQQKDEIQKRYILQGRRRLWLS